MSNPNYEKVQGTTADMSNPPPYAEKEDFREPDPLQPPQGPANPKDYGGVPPMPPQYQPYPDPAGAGLNQGPILQPPQAVYITPVQPTNEPDYLGYSIFTMLCCCLPLGIAALVYSIQTRESNHMGNLASAQRNSRMARILAHTALGVGLCITVLYAIYLGVLLSAR
ncbi:trafficking regulator of GLUT4 1-like [Sceloporus undulatus]|uniref:trafficking regulator of GLUT4 1-like n=1 Tax=Sceloporus undulatus TaxID=8520 RepID=UPI001C4D11FC|nr:trafficking regulator of GLUT4 1-like [Sceloporus undulatus]